MVGRIPSADHTSSPEIYVALQEVVLFLRTVGLSAPSSFTGSATERVFLGLFSDISWNMLPLIVFICISAVLCLILSGLSQGISRSIAQDTEKRSTYECGFSPHDSATRAPFDVHYYVVGIMFLVFDVEIALIFPFATHAAELDCLAYINMAIFVVVLTIGYAYEWARGALLWAVKLQPAVPVDVNLNNTRW